MRGDDGRLGVAVAPARVVLDEVAAELVLDERARRVVQLALGEPPLDRVVEARVAPLRPRVLRRPERDVRRDDDRGVEQHEPLDRPGRRAACSSERRAPNECPIQVAGSSPSVASIASRWSAMRHGGSHGDAPCPRRSGATTRWVAASAVGEALEVPAPRRDAVQADDGRRSLRAPGVDVHGQRPRHAAGAGGPLLGAGRLKWPVHAPPGGRGTPGVTVARNR